MLLEFYIPCWIAIIYNIYTLFSVARYVKTEFKDAASINFVNKLKFYPLILVICFTVGTIHRIWLAVEPENYKIRAAHAFLSSLLGFLNAIVYGMSSTVRQILYKKLCCKKEEEEKSLGS